MLREIVLAGLVSCTSAHMILRAPAPFQFRLPQKSSPLEADGSDFPCKNAIYDSKTPSNEFAQGSKQALKFTGSAVHGGGSCQVSITTDLKPSKNSVWKVIKSIEGGCPAKNTPGNLDGPGDGSLVTPFEYSYTIPQDLAAGNYTLAWTWFNKVGNREMYMNCAPISVTGSGGSKDALSGLPDMFVANVGNGCGTLPSTDLKFPNPGKDVDQFGKETASALKAPTGNCAAASGPQPTGGSQGSGSAPQGPTSAPLPSSSAGGAPPADPSGMVPGGVFITKSQEHAASQPAATNQAPVPSTANVPAPASSGPAPAPGTANVPAPAPTTTETGGGGGDAGAPAAGASCTTGMWNCIGGTSFQRCAGGKWSAVQAMAAGTKCSPGQAPDLKIDAVQANKRSPRRSRRFSA
ncbi:Chitin-binding, domain 3 [Metarhizium album ARSEF 1941]|uniref:Chitin-binding, domain 3 n=1 Tax=Metarhizium album (strain ARSEF 1941) TaxID=1081103 RepID=A0A0B2X4F3_METAS|nr:Chitin-binding, domain 3 [Metarhizium album ARSEF 1941]KHO00295.1 Chitin-binding, domain 3 [Metarhizium album ARSEF 1941]